MGLRMPDFKLNFRNVAVMKLLENMNDRSFQLKYADYFCICKFISQCMHGFNVNFA